MASSPLTVMTRLNRWITMMAMMLIGLLMNLVGQPWDIMATAPASDLPGTTVRPQPSVPVTEITIEPAGGTQARVCTHVLQATQGVAQGRWNTFRSTTWHVALDYPPGWSVTEQAAQATVTFSLAHGATIQLSLIDTGDLSPEHFLGENRLPHTRCSSSTNAYGVTVRTCFDTLAGSYHAYVVLQPSQGTARLLALTMLKRGDRHVFQAMIASVRPQTP